MSLQGCTMSGRISVFVMTLKMIKGKPGRSSDIVVKVDSCAEDPKATGVFVSNCIHPWVDKTKQHMFPWFWVHGWNGHLFLKSKGQTWTGSARVAWSKNKNTQHTLHPGVTGNETRQQTLWQNWISISYKGFTKVWYLQYVICSIKTQLSSRQPFHIDMLLWYHSILLGAWTYKN